jgi:hypothetical protein
MGCARCVRRGFFPLDEELALLAGHFTPSVYEGVTRLAAGLPFGRAVKEAGHFLQVSLTEATVRRQSEAAGAAYVALQTRAVERLEKEASRPVAGPARQFLSVDGALVPLVGGEWAEVKTLAFGTVEAPRLVKGETVIETGELSSFSRLTDATTFQRLALVETQRRGVDKAGAVGAVTDGSAWCQGFVDFHRPDAVRILDFPHAAAYVAAIGQAAFGEGSPEAQAWLTEQLHRLKHDGPQPVLATARQLTAAQPDRVELAQALAYLVKHEAQLAYPTFQAAGWPIGDGAVESANKLVVEARLKGSGMHWARAHVDPMLALRNIACNDRWAEAWPQITQEFRRQAAQRRAENHHQRHADRPSPAPLAPPVDPPPTTSKHITQRPLPLSPRNPQRPIARPLLIPGINLSCSKPGANRLKPSLRKTLTRTLKRKSCCNRNVAGVSLYPGSSYVHCIRWILMTGYL